MIADSEDAAGSGVHVPAAGVAPGNPCQFVTFRVEGQTYGIPIASVREIIRWSRTTPLPNQPPHARGVLNLRGTIIPIHDLRARLFGVLTVAGDTHVIVITCLGTQALGILVDAVSDILTVEPSELKAPPAIAETMLSQALVTTEDGRLVTILHLAGLYGLSAPDVAA